MPDDLVLLTNDIHADGLDLLRERAELVTAPDTDPDTLRRLAGDATGIVVRAKLPDDILDHAPRLKGMVRHGVGLDFIPVASATSKGLPVANLPGSNTNAVAEYVISTLLSLRRDRARFDRSLRDEGWNAARDLALDTREIASETLGIVGVGSVGSRVAAIAARGFGMRVIGASRRPGVERPDVDVVELDQLFAEADTVVLCCALTDETRGLVDARRLRLMRPDALLINVSRGPVVDTEALRDALTAGRIAGAALDVFDTQPLGPGDPLLSCPRLLLSPHVAAITATSMRAMSVGAAEEMLRILDGRDPVNFVNPEIRGS